MPSKIKGYNEKGEGKWFESNSLPEGWSFDDPNAEKVAAPELKAGDGQADDPDAPKKPGIIGRMLGKDEAPEDSPEEQPKAEAAG